MSELVVQRTTSTVPAGEWALMNQQAEALARSDIIPRDYRRKPANVLVAALTGRQHGWDALTAMNNGHVIEGKWGMKPEAMLGLVRQAGHSVQGSMSADGAEVTGKRADTGDEMTVTWTIEDARRAGLLNKGTWKQYPQMMCYWRAVAILCRVLFSDLTAGVHSTEELGASVDQEGNVIDAEAYEPVEPLPLSEDALDAFHKACTEHGVGESEVFGAAFPDGVPDPLTDAHLPHMRDTFKRLVAEKAKAAEEDDIQDAEIVEDAPEVEARPATKAQVGKIKGEYKRVGVEDRDAQLDRTTEVIGRPVESHNDLTRDEAAMLIEAMGAWEAAVAESE